MRSAQAIPVMCVASPVPSISTLSSLGIFVAASVMKRLLMNSFHQPKRAYFWKVLEDRFPENSANVTLE